MYTLVEIAVSLGVLTTLVTVLSACVCGCKNSNQKSELVGTAGVVKIRFDEEAPSPTPTTPVSVKRASTQNSQRSLPEIPHPVGRHDSGDTASEIYATVNLDEENKIVAAPTSREHPYEHAYAKLQNQIDSHNVTVEVTPEQPVEEVAGRDAAGPEAVVISASVAISGQLPSSQELPYITPPEPRHHAAHFSGDSTDSAKGYTSISVREPLSNIRAQSNKTSALQPHYATVSDDSDEMYAAIEEASVGEGSDTYAQIAPEPRRRDPAPDLIPDAHHARRSAPPEIGTSTSNATHSRQASSSSCSNSTGALGSPKPEKRSANSPLPPPPSASHVPHNSSHAPHNSSHTPHNSSHAPHSSSHVPQNSTHAQHNSTHPPHGSQTTHPPHPAQQRIADQRQHQRISSTGDLFNNDKLRRSLNEKHQRNNSCVSSSDFYGCNYPVEKHRFSSGDIIRPPQPPAPAPAPAPALPPPPALDHYNSIETSEPRPVDSPSRNIDEMYAKVMKRAKAKEDTRRSKDYSEGADAHPPKYRADDPGYETIDRHKSSHGYETIVHKERTISNQDPGYETVRDVNKAVSSNFNNNLMLNLAPDSGPDSLVSSDAGYEHINKGTSASDSDPNYEVLRNQPGTPPYAWVSKRPQYSNWPAANNNEPGYETVPPRASAPAPGAPAAPAAAASDADPNYETLNPQDPNYESLRLKDPKYESLRSKDSKYASVRSKQEPNYESVKYFDVAKREPPYERVDAGAHSDLDRSDSSAGYERINVPSNREPKNSINGADTTVSDYFQV